MDITVGNIYYSDDTGYLYLVVELYGNELGVLFTRYYKKSLEYLCEGKLPKYTEFRTKEHSFFIDIRRIHKIHKNYLSRCVCSPADPDNVAKSFMMFVEKRDKNRRLLQSTERQRNKLKRFRIKQNEPVYLCYKYVPSKTGIKYYGTRP